MWSIQSVNFNPLHDDLYAVSNFTDYISHDQGQTWEAVAFDHELYPNAVNFSDSKRNTLSGGRSLSTVSLASDFILKVINKGDRGKTYFPIDVNFILAYNARDRVYIGTVRFAVGMDNPSTMIDPQFRAHLVLHEVTGNRTYIQRLGPAQLSNT